MSDAPHDRRRTVERRLDGDVAIEDHGLIGDTRTAALVTSAGTIDWMCVPRFDGPPLFGRPLGGPEVGRFHVGPAGPATLVERRYVPGTATVEAVWEVGGSRLVLRDAMVAEVSGRLLPTTILVRRLDVTGPPVRVVVDFDPRLGPDRRRPRTRRSAGRAVCQWGALAVSLTSSLSAAPEPGRAAVVTVTPERPLTLVLAVADREPLVHLDPATAHQLVAADEARWRAWAASIGGGGRWRSEVVRSLITLRLLTYAPSGAPVAAVTTSLPEEPGGVRNWDYRYAWPRDASIGVAAFAAVGRHQEAGAFLAWLLHASRLDRPRLPALLTIDGRRVPAERTWTGWPGYRASAPVRVGNGAASQHQLDGYGWVVDAAWSWVQGGHRLNGETWRAVRSFADLVARRWPEPDAGIWEVRNAPAHHVHSKLMAWLALDRALRLAATHRAPASQRQRWHTARHALGCQIRERGFDESMGSYTRSYGSSELDAALLVLPLVGLEPAGSPRTVGTIAAVRRQLGAGGPLLYRYPPGQDGLPGSEAAFLPCSFWLAQALAASGDTEGAVAVFEELLDVASPLGLYGEELHPVERSHLGNYPQALTHAALVQAALAISRAEPGSRPTEETPPTAVEACAPCEPAAQQARR